MRVSTGRSAVPCSRESYKGTSLLPGQIPYNMQMDINRLCLERELEEFIDSGVAEDAYEIYYCFLEMFIGHYGKSKKMVELLSEYEANGSSLLMKHRDHYSHSVYVFALGLAIYESNEAYRAAFKKFYGFDPDDANSQQDHAAACCFLEYWGLTALFHDIGYPFELPFEQVMSYYEVTGEKRGKGSLYIAYHDVDAITALGEEAKKHFEKMYGRTFATSEELFAFGITQRLGQAYDLTEDYMLEKMKETGIKCLWGTSNLFNHKRFVHGAATSCNADAFAYAAASVKKAIDITKKLGGENYVFWGGREGYETLLNTKTDLELDNFARFLQMAVDYAKKIGFKGQFLIEPKPKEPTKHQYDFDTQTVLGFLRKYNLEKYFKVNIEANHATLAGHTFQHELNMARINGALGSIDANQGDMLLGWDTDQFPTNIYDATMAMYEVILAGGLNPGGLNFDAKVRRGSFETDDLLIAYIAGMDTFAKGLKVAAALYEDKVLENFKDMRYASYNSGIGAQIVSGKTDFEALSKYALANDQIQNNSGRQEMLEAIVNQYIYK